MKLAALLTLTIALSSAGLAMDGFMERHDCGSPNAIDLRTNPTCAGYVPSSRQTERLEWTGAAAFLVLSLVLFRGGMLGSTTAKKRLEVSRRSANVPDQLST